MVVGAIAVIGVASLIYFLTSSGKETVSEEEVPDEVPDEVTDVSPAPAPSEPAAASDSPAELDTTKEDEADALAAKKEEFKICTSKGVKYIKASQFEKAITTFTRAIEIAEELDYDVETLYNNRGAAYEKAKKFKESLTDCTAVLEANPQHIKVRKRRARIYVEQERVSEALIELCVILLTNQQQMKTKMHEIKISYGHNPTLHEVMVQRMQESFEPNQPENIQEVAERVGAADLELLWASRDVSKLKGRMAGKVAISQLLLGYGDYLEMEKEMRFVKKDELADAVESAEGAQKPLALYKLAFWYMTQREYQSAKDTLNKALEASKGSGLEGPDLAKLLSWVGVFEHMCYEMEAAKAHYDEARLADPDSIEVIVKQAGVSLDMNDLDGAEALFAEAEGKDPNSTDFLYHRSQLWMMKRDFVKVEQDLRACMAKDPNHTMAIIKLSCLLLNNQSPEVSKFIDLAQEQRPSMPELYQVKGEVALSVQPPDMDEALANFEKAIQLEETNALARVYKALTLYQMKGMDPNVAIPELEKALEMDPTCCRAYVHLAELKLGVLENLEDGAKVVAMLEGAADWCNDKSEFKELCMLRGIAKAQLEAAKQLGLTSLH